MHRFKLSLFLLIFSLTVSAALRTEKYTISFAEDDFSFSTDENGLLWIYPSDPLSSYPETNEPALPLFPVSYAIFAGDAYVSSTTSFSKRLIKTGVTLPQAPLPIPTDGSLYHSTNSDIKYPLISFPENNCLFTGTSEWPNISVAHFLATPFIYDAEEKNLYFIDSIDLSINVDSVKSRLEIDAVDISETEINLIKSIVENPLKLDGLLNDSIESHRGNINPIDYVIITNEDLKESFKPLLNWKKTKGLYSKIITVEEIETYYYGSDIQEKIKRCLYDLYSNNGLKYALLGGDDTVVPIRGCYAKVDSHHEEYSMPTDLYYACFGGCFEWDYNKNNLFGEVSDNISLAQSIYVSRAPLRSRSDVNIFSDKTINYEREPRINMKFLFAGAKLDTTYCKTPSDAEIKGDSLFHKIKSDWKGIRYKFYDTGTSFVGGARYNLTPHNLSYQLSQGYSFVDMITHGGPAWWGLENNTTYNSECAINQNNPVFTIVSTMACLTNAFDQPELNYVCLSEAFMRNPNSGVVAYLGCSREGWFSLSPNLLGTSLTYELNFYKNLFAEDIKEKNWAKIVAFAKSALIPNCRNNAPNRWVQFGLNPIGDPEMPIYTDTPKVFETARFTTKGNCVYIDTHVSGCRICIMSKEDFGESYYKVYEDEQNICIENIPDNCNICITKQGYIPTEYTLRQFQAETINSGNIEANVVIIGAGVNTSEQIGSVNIMGENTVISAGTVIIEDGTFIS